MNWTVKIAFLALVSTITCSACSYQRQVTLQPTDLPEYIYKTPMKNDYMAASVGVFTFREPPYATGVGNVAAELLYEEILENRVFAVVAFEPKVSGMTEDMIRDLARAKDYDLIITGDIVYFFEGSDHHAARVDERMRVIEVKTDRTLWYAKAVDVGPYAPETDYIYVQGKGAPAPSNRTLLKRNAEKFARLLLAMPTQKLWTEDGVEEEQNGPNDPWAPEENETPEDTNTRQFLDIPLEGHKLPVIEKKGEGQGNTPSSSPPISKQTPKEDNSPPQISKGEDLLSKTVYFPLDKASLSPPAKETLKKTAAWLKANPGISAEIQGHCDERGTYAYNMALGAQRAWSAKKHLASLGVSSNQMGTVSFGKERPVDRAHTEKAWAKNRRAEIVVQKK